MEDLKLPKARPLKIANTKRGWEKAFVQLQKYPGTYLVEIADTGDRFYLLSMGDYKRFRKYRQMVEEALPILQEEVDRLKADIETRILKDENDPNRQTPTE